MVQGTFLLSPGDDSVPSNNALHSDALALRARVPSLASSLGAGERGH